MRRRDLILSAPALLIPRGALGLTPSQRNILLAGTPGWVLRAGGVPAKVDINFATGQIWGGSLSSLLSITRASQETVTWRDGHLSYVANNTLALSDLGLQVWESRTNLHLHSSISDSVSGYTVNSASLTANATTAPDLTTTAASFIPTAVAGAHDFFIASGYAGTANPFTWSVYAKANGYANFQLDITNDGTNFGSFVLSGAGTATGNGSATATIVALGNGWYRCSVTLTLSVGGKTPVIYATGNSTVRSFTADGISGYFFWGEQIEQAAFGSPYIPTTTGTAARALDNVSLLSPLLSLFQGTAGSAVVAYGPYANVNANVTAVVASQSGSDRRPIYLAAFSTRFFNSYNGTTILSTANAASASANNKQGVSWDGTGRSGVGNNGTVATDTNAFGSIANLGLGNGQSNNTINANISRLTVWNSRVPNSALQGLTQ